MAIHPSAVIDPKAELGADVEIGPFCIIGPGVTIGDRCRLLGHVVIERDTTLGPDCTVAFGAVLGGAPQDAKYQGELTYLHIGARNIIREYVTIHRATGEGQATVVGDDNMLMAYCHLGHNVQLGSGIFMANSAGVSGHVQIEDRVVVGGMVGFHQFVRVGKLVMIGGMSKLTQDIPPYMLADGQPAKVVGTNYRGLKRAGMGVELRNAIKKAHRLLYRANLNKTQALAAIEREMGDLPEVRYLIDFVSKPSYAGRQLDPIAEAQAEQAAEKA